jgi:hypothetical protein
MKFSGRSSTERVIGEFSDVAFIHGVLQRSGTNFLQDLLLLHADCTAGEIPEDFLLEGGSLLTRYLASVSENWESTWFEQPRALVARRLAIALSKTLVDFCRGGAGPGRYMVSKTPSTLNIGHFFELFPFARLIVIVRDGRDVVESGMRTFGWEWECGVRQWRESANRIAALMDDQADRARVLIVRYEDLFADTLGEMRRVLGFLELDEARYDFQLATSLPVRGSCEFGRPQAGKVHWQPVVRSEDFAPVGRHWRWSRRRRRRFAWLAREVAAKFGYTMDDDAEGSFAQTLLNWMLDQAWTYSSRLREMRFLINRAMWNPSADFCTGQSHYYEHRRTQRLPLRDAELGG